ncbi:AMP-binding protein (plasmid) [Phormidium sp. CLA17]|uniref:class I adenylate-forming enzyme family protein n=1 Tax=Leptolyngbya sp. Cla-17 TaxID=2803751 RepID=UPI001490E911|nr:AMP-binding protein [Leptolyngbya sp. Cla-17]MBM0745270.1 AMP-binding protein [Leptolyngbya sp. Cla-17]
MVRLIRKLYRAQLLTPTGLFHLLVALVTTGVNLMALLRLVSQLHPHRLAVTDDRDRFSYRQLWQQAESLALTLQRDYGIQRQQKVAIACRNHAAGIKAIFAVSRLGANLFLLNPELSSHQMQALTERLAIDFFIFDWQDEQPVSPWLEAALQQRRALPAYHVTAPSIDQLSSIPRLTNSPLKTVKTGNIVVMTGGTTGQPKPASRKPSVLNFLPPFIALLKQVNLDDYRSLYIATPIYHGFGLAALLIGMVLGGELYVTRRFEAAQACALIATHQIEVVTLVPLMLQRMLKHNSSSLSSLQRILSGGAALSPSLVQDTLVQSERSLFNLYGTSEAGFCILGTPALLSRKPASIGQPVWGVNVRIVSDREQEDGDRSIGRLCIRSAWSTDRKRWIETGDLAYQDAEGDIFLCGRVDDMIVSGGENVYPIDLENMLMQHPDVDSAVVFGIPDAEFGQRLQAVVIKKPHTELNEVMLRDWLKPRVARYQMPALIEFRTDLPYTALGKPDKKALRDSGSF